ncbi:MAG: hypothetical protein QXZ41_08330 [Ignisphaera sp.]
MAVEDWKTYKYSQVELKKDVRDEVHEFLTKVFNTYMVRLPPNIFKQLDIVRDKLVTLTTRFNNDNYAEFCETFSKIYRLIILDKDVGGEIKNAIRELSEKTNNFFASKGMSLCVRELSYNVLRIKVLFESSPLKDALVAVESEGRVVASTKTSDNGVCSIEVPEGKYTVYVYKYVKGGQYIYEEKTVNVPVDSEVLFDIKETKSDTEIVRERGGRPIIKEIS